MDNIPIKIGNFISPAACIPLTRTILNALPISKKISINNTNFPNCKTSLLDVNIPSKLSLNKNSNAAIIIDDITAGFKVPKTILEASSSSPAPIKYPTLMWFACDTAEANIYVNHARIVT